MGRVLGVGCWVCTHKRNKIASQIQRIGCLIAVHFRVCKVFFKAESPKRDVSRIITSEKGLTQVQGGSWAVGCRPCVLEPHPACFAGAPGGLSPGCGFPISTASSWRCSRHRPHTSSHCTVSSIFLDLILLLMAVSEMQPVLGHDRPKRCHTEFQNSGSSLLGQRLQSLWAFQSLMRGPGLMQILQSPSVRQQSMFP